MGESDYSSKLEKSEDRIPESKAIAGDELKLNSEADPIRTDDQEALRRSELKFRNIVEQSDDGIILVDENGMVAEWNRALEALTGLRRSEVLGSPIWDIQFRLTPDEKRTEGFLEELKSRTRSYLKTGQLSFQYRLLEVIIQRPDGGRKTVQASTSVIKTSIGFMTSSILRDITDKKQVETELKKFKKAVETTPAALILTDMEGRIEYVNAGLLEMSGFNQAEEIVGRSVFSFTDEQGATQINEEVVPSIRRHGLWKGEIPLKGKDGRILIVEMICSLVLDDAEKPKHFLSTFYNITERKLAEEALILDEARLEALLKLNQFENATLKDITDFALEAGVKLTGSKLGHLAFVSEDEKVLDLHFWSESTSKECKNSKAQIVYPIENTGLWGEALRQRKSIITNDKIRRHMVIPILDKGIVVAVAAVANKEQDYDSSDERQLTLLMSGMWRLIQRMRAEEELKGRDRLLQGVAKATNYLLTSDPQAINKALEILGQAAGADMAYMIESQGSCQGNHMNMLRFEWANIGICAFPISSRFEEAYLDLLFPGWQEALASGKIIQRTLSEVCGRAREILQSRSIHSFLMVPILIDGRFSGIIGFDDCHKERHWTESETAILLAAASSIGEAVRRKQAEDALRESQRAIETLMSNLPGMAYRCKNDSDRTMEFVNAGCLELTGRTLSDLIDNRVLSYGQLIHPKDKKYVWNEVQAALEVKRPFRLVYRINALDGLKWVWEQGQGIFSPDGRLIALEGFIADITERKLAEEALQKAHDELEKRVQKRTAWLMKANQILHAEMAKQKKTELELRMATKAKSEFLAKMSHEIRTPMNAVIGMAGLLLDTALSPEQRDQVQTIRNSGDSLLAIINDILDFSKIEGGKMEIECQPFDLEECIQASLELVAAKASEKGLKLSYHLDEKTPKKIVGDVTRLRQILVNLLGNAVKFTDAGEVEVSVQTGARKGELHFAVRDTGIGIPEEAIRRLFQSFSQLEASTTRRYGGTGLGLAISKQLTEMMGGTIWAESVEGMGATFHFTISAEVAEIKSDPTYTCDKKPDSIADIDAKIAVAHPLRIIVAEDNLINQKVALLMLARMGYRADVAANGLEVLQALERQIYDVVLMDVQMPEMDGLEAVRRIRKRWPKKDQPRIIAMTAFALKEDRARCMVAGMDGYLSKPIQIRELLQALEGCRRRE